MPAPRKHSFPPPCTQTDHLRAPARTGPFLLSFQSYPNTLTWAANEWIHFGGTSPWQLENQSNQILIHFSVQRPKYIQASLLFFHFKHF